MPHSALLIHGVCSTGRDMARVARALRAQGYECHAPDLPFHEAGVDHPQVAGQSLLDYVAFLERYVNERRFRRPPLIVGHSMGGLLAQQLATRIETAALVLLAPAPAAGIVAFSRPHLLMCAAVLGSGPLRPKPYLPAYRAYVRAALAGIPRKRRRALYERIVAESGRAILEIGLWPADPFGASRVHFDRIRCPAYFVSGGLDRLVAEESVRKMAALHGSPTLRHDRRRGHMLIDDEATEAMIDDVAAWLKPILGSRGPRRRSVTGASSPHG